MARACFHVAKRGSVRARKVVPYGCISLTTAMLLMPLAYMFRSRALQLHAGFTARGIFVDRNLSAIVARNFAYLRSLSKSSAFFSNAELAALQNDLQSLCLSLVFGQTICWHVLVIDPADLP